MHKLFAQLSHNKRKKILNFNDNPTSYVLPNRYKS